MVLLGNFGATDAIAVTTEAAYFQGERPWSYYVIRSDRIVHLRRSQTAEDAATTDDFLLTEGEYVRVEIAEGDWLSFVLAAGETDGTVYITRAT